MHATVVMGQQGRVVIPAEMRSALRLHPGDRLVLQVVRDTLVVRQPGNAVEDLRALGRKIPEGRSLVAELIAERRAAAVAE